MLPENTPRRAFLKTAASAFTALSYSRVYGANDRISIGHAGIGDRGSELDGMVAKLKDKHNIEMTAVCDLWKVNREKADAHATTRPTGARRARFNISKTCSL